MKKFIAALALTLATSAFASEIKLLEVNRYSFDSATATFEVNEKLGRAWVEVELADSRFSETNYDYRRVKVEGLTYDAATMTVNLERDGQIVECGKLVRQRFTIGRVMYVKRSNRCSFFTRKSTVEVDNGFEIEKRPVLSVFLNVQ